MPIKKLQKQIIKFRDDRNWKNYHKPKDVAISIVLEATELLEHFQWKNEEEIGKYLKSPKSDEVKEEIADVAIYLLQLSHDLGIDLEEEIFSKLEKNAKKYPIEKIKGNYKKYTELK